VPRRPRDRGWCTHRWTTGIACTVICVQKGKTWIAVCGWALTLLAFIPGVAVLVVEAVRSAPGSRWALRRYADDPFKQQLALSRDVRGFNL
jgi:hypothetical protein